MDRIKVMFSDMYEPQLAQKQDSRLPGVSELLRQADELLGTKDSASIQSLAKTDKTAKKKKTESGAASKKTSSTEKKDSPEKVSLTFLHVNDLHGYVEEHEPQGPDHVTGGLARIAGKVNEERARNAGGTILLEGGDLFDGGFYSKYSGGEIVSKPYRQMGFDAMALGNHDLTWGVKAYETITNTIGSDVLAANVKDTSPDGSISKLIKPYAVLERKGVRIGILGLTSKLTQVGCPEKGIMEVRDAAQDLEKSVGDFKAKENVDLVVLLSHLGVEKDEEIANTVDGIDVIVGAHSHTQLEKGKQVKNTVIVQTAGEGNYLGMLDLTFDAKEKSIVSSQAQVIPITADIRPDREVEKIMAPYMEKYRPIKDEVLGSTNQDLIMYDDSVQATNLTNFFIDAQKMDSDFSLASMFSLRQGLKKGNITTGDLFTMYPFDNMLCEVKTSGSQVLSFLESALQDGYKGNYLIFSGIEYDYDPSLPEGKRITSLTTGGKTYDPEEFGGQTFTVAMDNYLQGKKYFKGSTVLKEYGKIFDILRDYVRTHSPLDNVSSELRSHKAEKTAA